MYNTSSEIKIKIGFLFHQQTPKEDDEDPHTKVKDNIKMHIQELM
jgi:hypothetical protein